MDVMQSVRSYYYIKGAHVYRVMVTGTPADKKGKEVKGSYDKLDHVLVSNGSLLVSSLKPSFLDILHFDCLLSQSSCYVL